MTDATKTGSRPFDLVVRDGIELPHAGDLLAPQGALLELDRRRSGGLALREAAYQRGWTASPPRRLRRALAGLGRPGYRVAWSVLIEPNLYRPRFLVPPGGARHLILDYGSPLRRRIKRAGWFYVQPRDRAAVLMSDMERSLLAGIASEALESNLDDEALRHAVRRLYVAATGTLVVELVWEAERRFLRLPAEEFALSRVRTSHELETRLRDRGIELAPRSLRCAPVAFAPYQLETGLEGRPAEPAGEADEERLAAAALDAMLGIHLAFGRPVRFDDAAFGRYVGPRLAEVRAGLLDGAARRALDGVGATLRSAFLGKRHFASLVHGDFKLGNCLFSEVGRLSGIVDWDLGSIDDLALVDWANLLVKIVARRHAARFVDLAKDPPGLPGGLAALLARCFEATGTAPLPLRAAFLFHWLERVAKQFAAGAEPAGTWSRRHVAPLLDGHC